MIIAVAGAIVPEHIKMKIFLIYSKPRRLLNAFRTKEKNILISGVKLFLRLNFYHHFRKAIRYGTRILL